MKHSNISIFIPHIGCPHRCSFCDQRTISGAQHAPSGNEVGEICANALKNSVSPENTEIAFFGGSFTAIPHSYMTELLEAAHPFIGDGKFRGIRVSTRPDCIDRESLSLLKDFGVTSIELGAQSLDDDVLKANERGHSAADVEAACGLIREYSFELGLQMMTGLYGSSLIKDMDTALRITALHPDTVRIYPVVVLKGTGLGKLFEQGLYDMVPLDEMAQFCGRLLMLFEEHGISVIKCGLHASEFVEMDMLAGYYHPAFRELCEMYIYRESIMNILTKEHSVHGGTAVFEVNDKCVSKAIGQKRANIRYFKECGIDAEIIGSSDVPIYEVRFGGEKNVSEITGNTGV